MYPVIRLFLDIKPIFHCDAKPFTLGPRVGLDTQRHNFVLPIPTCWYLKTLKFKFHPNPNDRISATPNANPQREQVEYRWRGAGIGHVHFMFFCVDFICVGQPVLQYTVSNGIWAYVLQRHFLKQLSYIATPHQDPPSCRCCCSSCTCADRSIGSGRKHHTDKTILESRVSQNSPRT